MPEPRTLVIPFTAAALVLVCGGILLPGDSSEEAVRATVRFTAGFSFTLLSLAFSASSVSALLAGESWKPVLRARRRIGIAFALSHTFHLATILLLVQVAYDGDYSQLGPLSAGAFIYTIIYTMAFTSNDASVRMLGARNWKRLHTVGGYILVLAFTGSYLQTALELNDYHWLFVALGAAVILLRLGRRFSKRA
jgi:DMSO/TMAO reductase YedYZ heme-binding membrane subunit